MIPLILLNEKEFTTTDDNEDYTLDPDKEDEETPPEEGGGEAVTADNVAKEDPPAEGDNYELPPDEGDGGGDETPPDEGGEVTGAEGDNPDDQGGDDYTIDADTEELADDDDENLGDETEGEEEITADSEMPEDQDKMHGKKVKKLLQIYKSFYNDIISLNDKVSNSVFPMNPAEEYIYKIVVDTLNRTIKVMYSYIVNEYNTKEYEENVYRLYHFKSQLEMMHILLKKIKKYRDEAKTI